MSRHPTPLRLALERIVFGAALCTVLALTFGGHASHAQSSKKKAMAVSAIDDVPFKPSVDTYTVQQGDTLWSIASKYYSDEYDDMNDYIKEIKYSNRMYSDDIHTGNYIIVPYYADASN